MALNLPIGLQLMLDQEQYWRGCKKTLTTSDVNGQSRLLWPKEIFPTTMEENLVRRCMNVEGENFEVEDIDTGTSYMLKLKLWGSGSFVFTTNWMEDFVRRRGLKKGDVIGLLWDGSSKFYFSIRHTNQNNFV